MEIVLACLGNALRDAMHRRMLALVLWPMGLSILFWGGLAWAFGATWTLELAQWLASTPIEAWLSWAGAEGGVAYAALFILVLLWLPAVYITALMITSVVLMPIIVSHVASIHYPELERRQGGSFIGSALNTGGALLIYLLAWLALLPFWLFAPFAMFLALLLNAWLNQRLFMYDALAEHASAEELAALRRSDQTRRYGLALILGLLHHLPLVNLLAPVFMGLAFTHYTLLRLQAQRIEAHPT